MRYSPYAAEFRAHRIIAYFFVVACASTIANAQVISVSRESLLSQSYAESVTPSQCVSAAMRSRQLIWRAGQVDTIQYGALGDSMPTHAVQKARECAARFSLSALAETVGDSVGRLGALSSSDFLPLIRLNLIAGWDDSVRAALDIVFTKSSVTAKDSNVRRDNLMFRVIQAYLESSPKRLKDAAIVMERLDALGSNAAITRLRAHVDLCEIAYQRADHEGLAREAKGAYAALLDIPENLRGIYFETVRSAYYNAVNAAAMMHDSILGQNTLASFTRAILPLLEPNSASPDSLREFLQPRIQMTGEILTYGVQASAGARRTIEPFTADYWFSANGTPIPPLDTNAAILVLVLEPHRCNGFDCNKSYGTLRRIAAEYQSSGISIVLFARTSGYLHSDVFEDAASEVKAIRAYVQDTLKLPGLLAIRESDFQRLEDRRIVGIARGNPSYGNGQFLLRDKSGYSRSLLFGFFSDRPGTEGWLRKEIAKIRAEM